MVRNAKEKMRVKVYLDPYPHIRLERGKSIQGWYKSKHEPAGVRPRPCYTEALLTEPYGGYCPVRCIHCYVNAGVRGYRGTGLVTVPVNYGEQVGRELDRCYRAAAGYITSFHDPFNPLESWYGNSMRTAGAFVNRGLPIFFLSRLTYPTWAIGLLRRNPYSYAQKSINTSDPDDWRRMSPGAPPLDDQLRDVRRLHDAGIYVSIQVNPVIPGVTSNDQLVELFRMLADAGADHVIVKFVEAGFSWAPTLVSRMIRVFGKRGKQFERLFNQNIGGQRTVDEDYRIRAHKRLRAAARRLGLTYGLCYEYCSTGKGEPLASLGPRFTTAAQCHGPAVPVYRRHSLDEPFQPLDCCPPSGCLYCVEHEGDVPPCGDTLMGEARKLRLKDLQRPWRGI